MYTTKKSLLKRMRKCDDISWDEFYKIYWPLVNSFGRKLGMQPEDCKDLMQEIMLDLFKDGALLRYDASKGKFRTFLGRLVRCKVADMLHCSARFPSVFREAAAACPQDENDPFQEMFDEEYRSFLLTVAMKELRNSVEPKTYAIFEMVALQERSPREVALHLGISRAIIDVYCSRCRKKLQCIIEDIRTDNPDFDPDISL
jgi:RNA polymerase sigma-70 factor (ECF subfamily)